MLPTMPTRPQGVATGPTDAARAAQRAFFSQALNAAQAQTPLADVARAAPVARQAAPVDVTKVSIPDQEPERPLRPGSLLDIRI